MQVDYAKPDLVVTVRNMGTHVHVQKDVIYLSINILYFIELLTLLFINT